MVSPLLNSFQTGNLSNIPEPAVEFLPTTASMTDEDLANYILFLDVLNFSFYYDDGSSFYIEYPDNSGVLYQVLLFLLEEVYFTLPSY